MKMNIFAGLERGLCCIIIVHVMEWEQEHQDNG